MSVYEPAGLEQTMSNNTHCQYNMRSH